MCIAYSLSYFVCPPFVSRGIDNYLYFLVYASIYKYRQTCFLVVLFRSACFVPSCVVSVSVFLSAGRNVRCWSRYTGTSLLYLTYKPSGKLHSGPIFFLPFPPPGTRPAAKTGEGLNVPIDDKQQLLFLTTLTIITSARTNMYSQIPPTQGMLQKNDNEERKRPDLRGHRETPSSFLFRDKKYALCGSLWKKIYNKRFASNGRNRFLLNKTRRREHAVNTRGTRKNHAASSTNHGHNTDFLSQRRVPEPNRVWPPNINIRSGGFLSKRPSTPPLREGIHSKSSADQKSV